MNRQSLYVEKSISSKLAITYFSLYILLCTGAKELLERLISSSKGFYKCSYRLRLFLVILDFGGKL
jgi:hypothetical protein